MEQKRIFLACQIPESAKVEIEKICQKLKSLGFRLRFTPKENLHLTLAFLARVDSQKLRQISNLTKSVCQNFSSFSLFLNEFSAFPNLKLPKVVFISLAGEIGILQNLTEKIQKGLGGLGFKFENEKFVPHVTLARIKSYVNKIERQKLGETIQRWGRLTPVKIPIDSLAIFESRATPAGHIHVLLEKINLGK